VVCAEAATIRQGALADDAALRPNVVIILTDDQGTLDANCYGSTDLFTPAIDRIAAAGVRFTQAYAHTVCCPARAMLMTGRHPQRSDVNSWMQGRLYGPKGRNMFQSEVTLAEALREAGYRTALYGKWHLGAHPDHGPTKQGFEEFFGIRGGFIDNYAHYQLHGTGAHDLFDGTQEVFHRGHHFPDMIDEQAPSRYSVMHWQWQNGWMVREGSWKLISGGRAGLGRDKLDGCTLQTWTTTNRSAKTMPGRNPISSTGFSNSTEHGRSR
jgi:arylsulfatase A-like enzyme